MGLDRELLARLPGSDKIRQRLEVMIKDGLPQELIEREARQFVRQAFKTMPLTELVSFIYPDGRVVPEKQVPAAFVKKMQRALAGKDLSQGLYVKTAAKKDPYTFLLSPEVILAELGLA